MLSRMTMTDIYLVPYHSEPGLHLEGSTGQFKVVEEAILADEWPYDNGDDPSFYVARRGGPLTWGVCRQQVRNSIGNGSIVVYFSFTSHGSKNRYRLSAVATVSDKLDRGDVYNDERLRQHRDLYLNVLVWPGTKSWDYDESDREENARHSDWLWRIAVHGKSKEAFQHRQRRAYKRAQFDGGEVELARNYILFSGASDETYIAPDPPRVATARKGRHERWTDKELRRLTVKLAGKETKSGRHHLRTENRSGRNVHPVIRFNLPLEEAIKWRKNLICALMRRSATEIALRKQSHSGKARGS